MAIDAMPPSCRYYPGVFCPLSYTLDHVDCHHCIWSSSWLTDYVEQARGIFYTTQDTLLLTYRGEGNLLVVEERREVDDHIGMMDMGIYT